MAEQHYLEVPFRQFSPRAVEALSSGKARPEALVRLIERAYCVAQGVETVLQLVGNSSTERDFNDTDGTPPLSLGTEEILRNFAREACASLAEEISRVAYHAGETA